MKSKFLTIPPGDVIDLSKVVYVRSHRYQGEHPFYTVKLGGGGDSLQIYETEQGYKHQLYHEQFGRVMYMPREEFLQHLMNWELEHQDSLRTGLTVRI